MKLVIVYSRVYEYAMGKPKRVGGAERQQWLLACALTQAGWDVTIGVRQGLRQGERVVIDRVHFVGMESGPFIWSCFRFLLSEQPNWWYWRVAEHWLGPAVEIAKLVGVKTIFAAAFDTDVEPRHALVRRPTLWPLYAWGLARVDRIFVQHGGQLERLPTQWQGKASVVPSLSGKLCYGFPHSERKGYVVWVGTLRQPKRADLLIEIARRLPEVKFIVCGGISSWRSTPDYGRQIVQGLSELSNVNYMGQMDPEITQQIIGEAGILLSTSDGEGFPNTFLEAWSSGTPVVSLKIDPDDVIQRKGLGVVARNLDFAISSIKHFLASPSLRDEMGERARRYVQENHGESNAIKIFGDAIRGISR
ncbi:MAG: glycosyltransferase family 4 protein [Nitrospira sp.]|nr:glycosyltransferase family 4 protein [Nitrospira sp.]